MACAAGLGDEDLRRGRVPRVEVEVDHRVDAAAQHERVAEGVGVAAQDRNGGGDALPTGELARAFETEDVAVRHDRLREVALGRDARRLAVAQASAALPADITFAEQRQVDQPEPGFAVDLQRDQRRVERQAARVGDRSVDRIDDPLRAARGDLPAVFLAEHRDVGERLAERLADHAFGGAVRFGDG